ncbi:hypothetical protein BT63DRAFT_421587 [Microthyrium microscopicum]|uniref:C2H2-type domain-containing protein n=1 Tax=Microthyrium microscopicum TaxID=703497 RepID=A0A6A6UMD1_9PEZI|nr:hypothetical protein BT63DRAFT_421587 [Microthyrium microscopicum]
MSRITILTLSAIVNNAIDYLEKNADKSIEDLKAESTASDAPAISATPLEGAGLTASSWMCNECGKKFRTTTEMQFHANKSGHTDMAESIEEIAPLTPEEKAAKLAALKEKLAAKRATNADQDKEDRKKNEQIRLKATKESQDIREKLQNDERIKEAAKKRQEKKADEAARKKILMQIEADKAERRAKAAKEKAAREGKVLEEKEEVKAAPVVSNKPKGEYTEARLRLQTTGGNVMKTFPAEATLFEVAYALKEESGVEVTSFSTTFPRKTFDNTDFGMTLKEAGFVPSAALVVK